MLVTLTVKLTAESQGELTHEFAREYREFREALEMVVARGAFLDLPPAKIELRWLLDSGWWDESDGPAPVRTEHVPVETLDTPGADLDGTPLA